MGSGDGERERDPGQDLLDELTAFASADDLVLTELSDTIDQLRRAARSGVAWTTPTFDREAIWSAVEHYIARADVPDGEDDAHRGDA